MCLYCEEWMLMRGWRDAKDGLPLYKGLPNKQWRAGYFMRRRWEARRRVEAGDTKRPGKLDEKDYMWWRGKDTTLGRDRACQLLD